MATTTAANIGRFYGVYLLCSESIEKRYRGKCYIGFTVNPNRRIKQHNRGKDFGGAKKTSNKGPWKMVMIVHGFPNNIAALQFEWAWQQPMLSSRLRIFPELKRKRPKETYFQYNFRILSRMLNVGPWCRLPLTVRWLELEYKCDFESALLPPRHMQIATGAITLPKNSASSNGTQDIAPSSNVLWAKECHLCMQNITSPERTRMGCLNSTCKLTCHMICLANHMIASDSRNRGHLIPIEGECPLCDTALTWVALLQHKHKIQGRLCEDVDTEDIELDIDDVESESSSDAASSDDEKTNEYNEKESYKPISFNADEIYEISD